jgi:hypothetical protein
VPEEVNVWTLTALIAGAELTQPEPFDVRTLPLVPGDVRPVPPLTAARVPVTPVVRGKPVTFVITPEAGVPSAGLVIVGLLRVALLMVGDVERTLLPDPVLLVTPVPPLATASVPATVTAPVDGVDGRRPVEPKSIVAT